MRSVHSRDQQLVFCGCYLQVVGRCHNKNKTMHLVQQYEHSSSSLLHSSKIISFIIAVKYNSLDRGHLPPSQSAPKRAQNNAGSRSTGVTWRILALCVLIRFYAESV